jgi:excisionase family DNA binding protein
MDADEVSEFTRISKHFIGKLIKARAIPHMEVGKHRVFDRLMITQWLTEHYVPDPRMEISHEDN